MLVSKGMGASSNKSSWPLLTLAALAFVPGLGFILGAAAVTWGLISDRPKARLAIGIGVAGALCNVIGAVVLTMVIQENPAVQSAAGDLTRHDLGLVVTALDRYHESRGRYPATLYELVGYPLRHTLLNIYDQSAGLGIPRLYQYHCSPDSTSYDIFAVGPDGKPGTSDDIRPTIPDSLRARTGYIPTTR